MAETIKSLPPGEKYPHGTRARYVGAKCRCDECKAANRAYYHERKQKEREAAGDHRANPDPRVYMRLVVPPKGQLHWKFVEGCPGLDGKSCEWQSALRMDSKHGVCGKCRRQMGWNGLVDATPAREHLETLSKRQVGYKAVAEAAGISESVMFKILTGERKQIRNRNLQAILGVDESARADAALVDGKETRKLLRRMVTLGYTKGEIAQRLGNKRAALQIKKGKVLLRTAHKVKKLHREILEEQELMKELKHLCEHCGRSHHKLNRQRHLRAALPATAEVLREVLACFYGDGSSKAEQDLSRDLRAIFAVKEGPKNGKGPWGLP